MIGDFIEIIVTMVMAAPEHTRADLLTVVTHVVNVLQKSNNRILH